MKFRAEILYASASLLFFLLIAAYPSLRQNSGFDLSARGQPELYMHAAAYDASYPAAKNVLSFSPYTVKPGDTVSGIAESFGLNQGTVFSCNESAIRNAYELRPGVLLQIPNMDGIFHTIKSGERLEDIAGKLKVAPELILEVNALGSLSELESRRLFVPSAELDWVALRRFQGELFSFPLQGWRGYSSGFGLRNDPFTGIKRHHNGVDIPRPLGSPVQAAMDGRVAETGYNESAGNYVIIGHIAGYTTFYAHLSAIQVVRGQRVREGQRIGEVGSTGYSTGSHLHFTVFQHGRAVNPAGLMH